MSFLLTSSLCVQSAPALLSVVTVFHVVKQIEVQDVTHLIDDSARSCTGAYDQSTGNRTKLNSNYWIILLFIVHI